MKDLVKVSAVNELLKLLGHENVSVAGDLDFFGMATASPMIALPLKRE